MNSLSRLAQAALISVLVFSVDAVGQVRETVKSQVVLLGTGTPGPDPARSGPSTAIVVNGRAYIVDFGTGVVRRAAAARDKGIASLEPVNLSTAFLTHLHSDHTLGFADLILTPWIMGRKQPLDLYGPTGTRQMADYLLKAYEIDIKVRTEGLEHGNTTGYRVNVHEIGPGVVYHDGNVTVSAFNARHGELAQTYGYRFDAPDRTIVISGDASARSDVVANCNRCDVLIHEVYTQASFEKVSPDWKRYRLAYHTSTKELADIANKAKPRLLIIYHRENPGCDQVRRADCRAAGSEEQALREIRQFYQGAVVAGHDLDVY